MYSNKSVANIFPHENHALGQSLFWVAPNRYVIVILIENPMGRALKVIILPATDRPPENQTDQRHHYDR